MAKLSIDTTTVVYGLAAIPVIWLAIYLYANISMLLLGAVDLKKKYNAKWV